MKKNISRYPRIRGRILEGLNVDEHMDDNKFLINADACACDPLDIKDTLEAEGLSVSVSGKWVTVRTTSEVDAKEAAKAIRKVCKGKYATFVINSAKSHEKASHAEFIKEDKAKKESEDIDVDTDTAIDESVFTQKQRKKTITKPMQKRRTNTIQNDVAESLISFYKNNTDRLNESTFDVVYNIRTNHQLVDDFIRTYKQLNESSKAVNEVLGSLKRWSSKIKNNYQLNRANKNRYEDLNTNHNEYMMDTYGEDVIYLIREISDGLRAQQSTIFGVVENPMSRGELKSSYEYNSIEENIKAIRDVFSVKQIKFFIATDARIKKLININFEAFKTVVDVLLENAEGVGPSATEGLQGIAFSVYQKFVEYMKYTQNEILPRFDKIKSIDEVKFILNKHRDEFETFMETSGYIKYIQKDEKMRSELDQLRNFLYGPDVVEDAPVVNEAKLAKEQVINKIEGYFIGKGNITGSSNKSKLLHATINEGIKPLIESERDAEQKRLLESFERWSLFNANKHINESELVDLETVSDVDAIKRKALFESAVVDLVDNARVKSLRTSNLERIKKYL